MTTASLVCQVDLAIKQLSSTNNFRSYTVIKPSSARPPACGIIVD